MSLGETAGHRVMQVMLSMSEWLEQNMAMERRKRGRLGGPELIDFCQISLCQVTWKLESLLLLMS